MDGWTVTVSYGGVSETFDNVEGQLVERLDFFDKTTEPRSISMALPFRELNWGLQFARGHKPGTATGVVSRDGEVVLAGRVQGARWSVHGAPVRFTISEEPWLVPVEYPTSYELRYTSVDYEGLAAINEFLGALGQGEVVPPADLRGDPQFSLTIGGETFSAFAEKTAGRVGPIVFGHPGFADGETWPATPAFFADTTGGAERLLIAYHRVSAPTVTVYGPDSAGDTVALVCDVDAGLDSLGRPVSFADIEPHVTAGDFVADLEADWRVAWTGGEALSGLAGDVLAHMLQQTGARLDLARLLSSVGELNQYRLAGYIDDIVDVWGWVSDVYATLPTSLAVGPGGLYMWMYRPDEAPVATLDEAKGFEMDGDLGETTAEPVSRVEIRFRHREDTGERTEVAAPPTTYTLVGALLGGGPVKIDTLMVDERATAERMAIERHRLLFSRHGKIRGIVRRAEFGHLRAGHTVEVNAPTRGVYSRRGIVSRIADTAEPLLSLDVVLLEDLAYLPAFPDVIEEDAVLPDPPENTAAPVASGTPHEGETLSCTTGTWTNSPTSYAYQWQQDQGTGTWTDISGATSSTWLVDDQYHDNDVRCEVTASNGGGAGTPEPSNALGPVVAIPDNTVAPALSGTVQVLETVTCNTGTWDHDPTGFAYQWQQDQGTGTWIDISGETTNSYEVEAVYTGNDLRCEVTASNAAGSEVATSDEQTIAALLVPERDSGSAKDLRTPAGDIYPVDGNNQATYLRIAALGADGAAIEAGDSLAAAPYFRNSVDDAAAGAVTGLPTDNRLTINAFSASDYLTFDLATLSTESVLVAMTGLADPAASNEVVFRDSGAAGVGVRAIVNTSTEIVPRIDGIAPAGGAVTYAGGSATDELFVVRTSASQGDFWVYDGDGTEVDSLSDPGVSLDTYRESTFGAGLVGGADPLTGTVVDIGLWSSPLSGTQVAEVSAGTDDHSPDVRGGAVVWDSWDPRALWDAVGAAPAPTVSGTHAILGEAGTADDGSDGFAGIEGNPVLGIDASYPSFIARATLDAAATGSGRLLWADASSAIAWRVVYDQSTETMTVDLTDGAGSIEASVALSVTEAEAEAGFQVGASYDSATGTVTAVAWNTSGGEIDSDTDTASTGLTLTGATSLGDTTTAWVGTATFLKLYSSTLSAAALEDEADGSTAAPTVNITGIKANHYTEATSPMLIVPGGSGDAPTAEEPA